VSRENCASELCLGNDRIVPGKQSQLGRFCTQRGSGMGEVYEKIMLLGISFGLGVVDPNPGTNGG
jgi:hypothetical protein